MSSEKRRDPRIPFILKVNYSDRKAATDATENLSRGGLFVQTDQHFEMGQVVPLSLSFPGLLNPLELVGRVAWLRKAENGQSAGVGIEVDNAKDKARLEQLLSTVPEAAPAKPLGEGYRVLIVEDNPHIVEMYAYVLKKLAAGDLKGKNPVEVDFARDGHEAVNALLAKKYSLVMTDLYMPVMDGFELIARMRKEPSLSRIPIVVISAGGKDAQEQIAGLGVDIFLRKPVKFAEVLETVKQLLRIR